MTLFFLLAWTVLILTSIVWYAVLLFYVGIRGGRDIARMAKALREKDGD